MIIRRRTRTNEYEGGNAWNLLDFDYQSAAIVCVDTIKYYSIPSVPSRLEGVKTRPGAGWGTWERLPCARFAYTPKIQGVYPPLTISLFISDFYRPILRFPYLVYTSPPILD